MAAAATPSFAVPPSPAGIAPEGALLSSDIQSLYPTITVGALARRDLRVFVIGVANPDLDDSVRAFRNLAGLPSCSDCFRHVRAPAGPVAGGSSVLELPTSLQVRGPSLFAAEAAMASCPRCHLTYVEAASSSPNNVGMAVAHAMRAMQARLIVVPFNATEPQATDINLDRNFYRVRGLTLLVAAGDNGSHSRVGMPATSSTALAVGGTTVEPSFGSWTSRSWGGTSATCDRFQPQPAWQRGATDCNGRGVADLSAAADPDRHPFGAIVTVAGAATWTPAGGTAVAAGLLAGWAARSNLAGILSPSWLYGHREVLTDVVNGPSNRCVDTHLDCVERPETPEDDCTPALSSPRTCVPARGWDGLTGLGTPTPRRERDSTPHGSLLLREDSTETT